MYNPNCPPGPAGYPSAPPCPPAFDDVGFQPQHYPPPPSYFPHGTPVGPTGYVPGQPASSAGYIPPSSGHGTPVGPTGYVPGQPASSAGYIPPSSGHGTPVGPTGYVPGQPASSGSAYPPYHTPPKAKNTSSGLFGDIGRTISSVAGTIVSEIDQFSQGDAIITQLRPRNIIQLYTREHGTALQIVTGPYGLVVDSRGPLSPHAFHAHWKVHKENGNIITFSNNDNYLAVVSGNVCVLPNANGPMMRFRAKQWDRGIYFECVGTPGSYLHVTKEGNVLKVKEGLHSATVFYIQTVHEPR